MKKTRYFQIKSKIYHYYLAAVVMIFIILGTILSIVVAREIVQSANKETTKWFMIMGTANLMNRFMRKLQMFPRFSFIKSQKDIEQRLVILK